MSQKVVVVFATLVVFGSAANLSSPAGAGCANGSNGATAASMISPNAAVIALVPKTRPPAIEIGHAASNALLKDFYLLSSVFSNGIAKPAKPPAPVKPGLVNDAARADLIASLKAIGPLGNGKGALAAGSPGGYQISTNQRFSSFGCG